MISLSVVVLCTLGLVDVVLYIIHKIKKGKNKSE